MTINQLTAQSKSLVDVATGRKPADLVIKNGKWINVQSGEIIPGTDIAISGERIAYVGPDASHTIGDKTEIIQASDKYMSPGFLDGHMHVESTMLTLTELARSIVQRGTTGIFIDPHEIANVFGLNGIRLMVNEAKVQPIHVWVQIPSCVPSAPGLETPGASIEPHDVVEAMEWNGITGLGEVMNYPGVIYGDQKMHEEIAATNAANKVIGGHYASPDLGIAFHGYAAGGPEDDHEGTSMEDAIARIRQGMKVMLREGSAFRDVEKGAKAITENGLDSRHFILCTDDSHAHTLIEDGHMDRVINQAIQCGIPPLTAIQMATINTAEHFGVSKDIGLIAPGRFADIVIVSDIENIQADLVVSKGHLVAKNGTTIVEIKTFNYPDWSTNSVHFDYELNPDDFRIQVTSSTSKDSNNEVIANVIGVIEDQAPTKHLKIPIKLRQGEIKADIEKDLAKVAIIDRHSGNKRIQLGLVKGFAFDTPCAVASTVAHDCHQMVVVGTNNNSMAIAANKLAEIEGGQVVVNGQNIIGLVELPLAGLMGIDSATNISQKAETILEGFRACGCSLHNPNIQLSFLPLVVIPELRISDLGLVDVLKFDFIPLFELDA